MDSTTCQEWLDNVLVPFVEQHRHGKNVCLLWDNCPGHKVNTKKYLWLRIVLLLLNVTLVFQPMDMGIFVSVKRQYKTCMLMQIIYMVEE